MGMFDSMWGWATCPSCGSYSKYEAQFKWDECMLANYHLGDFVGGDAPYEVLTTEQERCRHCSHAFRLYVIGKMGSIYGFCNDEQYKHIENLIEEESTSQNVLFSVPKQWLEENIEEALAQIKAAYLQKNVEGRIVITNPEKETSIKSHVSQIPYFVEDPERRADAGETWFYDTRENGQVYWDHAEESVVVTKRIFQEHDHSYIYDVQKPNGEIIHDVHESRLLSEGARNQILNDIGRREQKILAAYHRKQNPSIELLDDKRAILRSFSFHTDPILYEMKERGLVPEDFEL